MKTVHVECYSGSRYGERPIAVYWQGQRLEIRQVLHNWRTPGGLRFDVVVDDERKFRLLYDEKYDIWSTVDMEVE